MGLLRNIFSFRKKNHTPLNLPLSHKTMYPSFWVRVKDIFSHVHFFKKKSLKERMLERLAFRTWSLIVVTIFIVGMGYFLYGRVVQIYKQASGADPIAYWKFDEGQGTTTQDSSSNNQDGTFGTGNSAPTWASEENCVSGKCLFFDGSWDVVDIADSTTIDVNQHTLSAWVRLSSIYNSNYVIFSKWEGSGNKSFFLTANPTTRILQYSLTTNCSTQTDLSSATALSTNKWHHVAATYDGSNMRIYIDGKQDAIGSLSGTVCSSSSKLTLGHNNDPAAGAVQFFTGYMDEPKIYNYARTAAQIKTDYAGGAAGFSAVLGQEDNGFLSDGLVGYWKMDEVGVSGSNWTAVDSSGNGNNGTGVGNASVGTTQPGKFGNGGSFDGNGDYISMGDNSSYDFTSTDSQFTLSAWIKPTSLANDNAVISKYDVVTSTNRGWEVVVNSSGNIYIALSEDGSYSTSTAVLFQTTDAISSGEWTHVAASIDINNDIFKIYLDGEEASASHQNTLTTITDIHSNSANVLIGAHSDGYLDNEFTGSIDDVRIYNRVLNPSEVSALYNWAPGPSIYYSMDQASGTSVVNDMSGNNKQATMSGFSASDWVKGKLGGGLYFDGTSNYLATASPSLPTTDFTFTFWANFKDIAVGGNHAVIDTTGNEFTLIITEGSFDLHTNGSWLTWTPEQVSVNEWRYITVTRLGSTVSIYIDGILQNTATDATAFNFSTCELLIGVDANSGCASSLADYANFVMDDFKIYNYARTPAQIIQDMNGSHPAPGSPVGSALLHYRLDEGYGTTVNNAGNAGSTLNGTFGTGNSAPTWTNDGKFGKALSFDGTDDRVIVSSDVTLDKNAGQDQTIAIWIKPSSTPGSNARAILVNRDTVLNDGYELLYISDSTIRLQFDDGPTSTSINTGSTVPVGKWTQVVYVLNSATSTISAYLNGVYESSVTDSSFANDATNSTPLTIGYDYRVVSNIDDFHGLIDDVKIYNLALTSEQILVEYNQGKALVLGAGSTGLGGTSPSYSAARAKYCLPGDTATCNIPVGEWEMDQGTGTSTDAVKDTASTNHGDMEASMSNNNWVKGKYSSALTFDGTDDYVLLATYGTILSQTGNMTITAWVNPTTQDGDRHILSKYRAVANRRGYTLNLSSGKLRFDLGTASDTAIGVTSPSTVSIGEWTHVAGLIGSDNIMRLFINGKEVSTLTYSGTRQSGSSTETNIGAYGDSGLHNSYFAGKIDNVRLYDYARTPAQIAWEYNQGQPVAWYRMDEGSGSNVYNAAKTANGAAAGNDGTLTVGASGSQTTTTQAWDNGSSGKFGGSLNFDGTDDYIAISDPSYDNFGTGPMSVAAWVKTNGSVSAISEIVDNKTEGTNNAGFNLQLNNDGRPFFRIANGSSQTNIGATTASEIDDGNWHHLVGVFSRTNPMLYLYVDGKLHLSSDATSQASWDITSSQTLYIGAYGSSASNSNFPGQIDDVKIFNYALTPAQIKTEMASGAVRFQ